mgnify:FL=1
MRTICYKLDTPIIYNKGTKYEKHLDTFLETYISGTDEEIKAIIHEMNQKAKDRVYFMDEQPMFDTTGN